MGWKGERGMMMRVGGRNEEAVEDLHLVIETRRFLELGAVTPTECDSYPPHSMILHSTDFFDWKPCEQAQ